MAHQPTKRDFATTDNGQIVLYEGCKGCGDGPLDHHPIKIPRVEWEWDDEQDIPVFTRWYDLYCYTCALAIMSDEGNTSLDPWLEKHGLKRLKFEDIKCPRATKEEIKEKTKDRTN